ncbi:phage tail sheath subtilisin-like domain-containing protein [Nodularia spumigena CS-591/12]|uniref:phage tail sheath subtilisin-like domain-containing protein n=1 Tax=Nodularia spumigena TaxID=70799 RepID=UPI00232C4471|nr:phage tail sheath subtilisin-like domain-containing protein [Nodularia spumigena]MDB9305193.1 phage tail sheath subtilisin-like domain-containing protein [Nodularia spumigena CS-591/12]
MPVNPTYPGVYIEEISSGVRTITGVSTSITAFVGYTPRGELNKAVRIFNFGDFERAFGGLHPDSEISYSIQQFFLNGGTDGYVVRVAQNAGEASQILKYGSGENENALTVKAANAGKWGENLFVTVDYGSSPLTLTSTFNLTVTRQVQQGNSPNPVAVETEKFLNLTMNSKSAKYAPDVINSSSKLIRVEVPTGLFSGDSETGFTLSGDLSSFPTLTDKQIKISGVIDGEDTFTLILNNQSTPELPFPPTNINQLVTAINNAITAANLTSRLVASRADAAGVEDSEAGNFIKLASRSTNAEIAAVEVTIAPDNEASSALQLGINNGGQEFAGARTRRPLAVTNARLTGGSDGSPPQSANDILGGFDAKTGIYALRDVDLFNLLVIPETTKLSDSASKAVIQSAVKFCEDRRAFYIIDPPPAKGFTDIGEWAVGASKDKNAAIFFPRILAADPKKDFRLRDFPASGAIAGIFSRTDSDRGVWKAPAGIEAVIRGAQGLTYTLTDPENGVLNPLGINCLRTFPAYGTIVWGARTRQGADQDASEWKYIPVRRLALFLQESLYRGTQWVVFEPNDEPLWAQIRLNIGAFMNNLFRQGAFQGKSPKEAYFVKCDSETTTQNDINLGIVNIVVGYAPLKPAEFVILQFQQMAGQISV